MAAIEERHFPPDARHLAATVRCEGCGETFARYRWPTTVALETPVAASSVPAPELVTECPACGAPLAAEPQDPE